MIPTTPAPAAPTATTGKRLFFGVPVSVATANALAQCAETLARRARDAGADVRWAAPTGYHVTLKYLGWTRDDAVSAARDAAAAALAGAGPFRFRTSRLGAFASLDKATVVWAGVEDPKPLADLAARLDRAMAALGFAAEARPFAAHVTLGRLQQSRPLRDVVLPMSEQMFSETRVEAVTLYESETKPGGSIYKEVAKISLVRTVSGSDDAEKRQTDSLHQGANPTDLEPDTDDGWPRGRA